MRAQRRPLTRQRELPLVAGLAGLLAFAVFGLGVDQVPVVLVSAVVAVGLAAGVIASRNPEPRVWGSCVVGAAMLMSLATVATGFTIGFLFAPAAILWLLGTLDFLWRRRQRGPMSAPLVGAGVGLVGTMLVLIVGYAIGIFVVFLAQFD